MRAEEARRPGAPPLPEPDVLLPRPHERAAARGAHALIVVLMLVGSAQIVFLLGVEAFRLVEARGEVARLERQVRGLEAEAAQLQAVADHGADEAYRVSLARLQGFMYPDEIRAVTSSAPTHPPIPSAAPAPDPTP